MTQVEYAAHADLSPGRVAQLVAEGLPLVEGKIEPVAADAWRKANSSPARQAAARRGMVGSTGRPAHGRRMQTTADARRAKLQADAGLSELKLREKSGELIRRSDAELLLFEKGREIRDSWLSWVSRIAPAMSMDLDIEPARAFAWLDRVVREHLTELSKIKSKIEVETEAEEVE